MQKAYAKCAEMLADSLGGSAGSGGGGSGGRSGAGAYSIQAGAGRASAGSGGGGLSGTPRGQLAALLQAANAPGQQGTATLVVLVALLLLVYRLSLGDVLAMQMVRRITGPYLSGAPAQ